MTIEEQVKALILQQYKSLRAFTNSIGVPYSTVDAMLKRGIGGGAVSTVIKICDALGITADGVARGVIELSAPAGFVPAPEEKELILKFRALDDMAQARILNSLDFEYQAVVQDAAKSSISPA